MQTSQIENERYYMRVRRWTCEKKKTADKAEWRFDFEAKTSSRVLAVDVLNGLLVSSNACMPFYNSSAKVRVTDLGQTSLVQLLREFDRTTNSAF